MIKMFKEKETLHSSWDGIYPIDLKNDKREGKIIRSTVENKKEGRRTQN
jgi:hypothetical protein